MRTDGHRICASIDFVEVMWAPYDWRGAASCAPSSSQLPPAPPGSSAGASRTISLPTGPLGLEPAPSSGYGASTGPLWVLGPQHEPFDEEEGEQEQAHDIITDKEAGRAAAAAAAAAAERAPNARASAASAAAAPVAAEGAGGAGPHVPGLELEEQLGAAGAGAVTYKGRWHQAPAVVKVLYTGGEMQTLARVTEMAVLSTSAHPSIVACYACFADMVEEAFDVSKAAGASEAALDAASKAHHAQAAAPAPAALRFRRQLPGEALLAAAAGSNSAGGGGQGAAAGSSGPAMCDIIVTEFCDRGTLAAALDGGLLLSPGGGGVDAAAACALLLDVAAALQFLHSMRLAHGGVCAQNVLLKTDRRRFPLGIVAKIADFGACQLFDREGRPLRAALCPDDADAPAAAGGAAADDGGGAGAPALQGGPAALQGGPALRLVPCEEDCGAPTPADDVHAFGTLLWQVFAGRPARAARTPGQPATHRVPPGAAALAAACWAAEPAGRPSAAEVARELGRLLMEARLS